MDLCWNKEGEPITEVEWAMLFSDMEYRRIGRDDLGPVRVSTVWVGIGLDLIPGEIPFIFETMIFGGEFDEFARRYQTLEEAEEGHEATVDMLRTLITLESLDK